MKVWSNVHVSIKPPKKVWYIYLKGITKDLEGINFNAWQMKFLKLGKYDPRIQSLVWLLCFNYVWNYTRNYAQISC
jgi:hypothetical protein